MLCKLKLNLFSNFMCVWLFKQLKYLALTSHSGAWWERFKLYLVTVSLVFM